MAKVTYMLEWRMSCGTIRQKWFFRSSEMLRFNRVQLAAVTARRRFYACSETKKAEIVFSGNTVFTKAQLNSLLALFD